MQSTWSDDAWGTLDVTGRATRIRIIGCHPATQFEIATQGDIFRLDSSQRRSIKTDRRGEEGSASGILSDFPLPDPWRSQRGEKAHHRIVHYLYMFRNELRCHLRKDAKDAKNTTHPPGNLGTLFGNLCAHSGTLDYVASIKMIKDWSGEPSRDPAEGVLSLWG